MSFNGAQGSAVTTAHGAISIDAAGNYTYTLNDSDAAVQALGEGQTLTETVAVTVKDKLGATSTKDIVVTIHGTNDAPVFTMMLNRALGKFIIKNMVYSKK